MLRQLIIVLAAAALAACGGSSGDTKPFGGPAPGGGTGGGGTGGGTAVAADLILVTSATQLANTSSSIVNITVTAVDSARVVVAGAAVALSADGDGVVTQSGATTSAGGTVTGTLSIGRASCRERV